MAKAKKSVTKRTSVTSKPKIAKSKTTKKVAKKTSATKSSHPILTDGSGFDLKNYIGQNVVLYFYPRDNTPGCTQEGLDFSVLVSDFKKLNTVVLGVSKDSKDSHIKFKEKMKYKVDLVADESGQVCEKFDVIKEKNMYGKKVMGIERSTFVFDIKGKLVKEWRKVKVEGHAKEVLDFVKSQLV